MNIIDIILLAILGISFISGMQKGFLTSLLATFGFVAAWILASAVNMTLSDQFMASQFCKWLHSNVDFNSFFAEMTEISGEYCQNVSGSVKAIAQNLTNHNMPAAVVSAFEANILSYPTLTVYEYLQHTVFQAAFNVISFVIAFAISYAVILLVVNLLNNMFRMPKIRGVDGILGGILGAVRGYAVICLVVAIIPMAFTALSSDVIETLLEGSKVGDFFLNSKSAFRDLFSIGNQVEKIIMELPKVG